MTCKKILCGIFVSLLADSASSNQVAASPVQTCDLNDGTQVVMYYSSQPKKEVGPAYTCMQVARVRTCESGRLSQNRPECSDRDSGGCADSWLQQLPDEAFTHFNCQD